MKCVSRYGEASAGGGSFAGQGGLIARQNLAICVSRTTRHSIITNLPSGWFYQDYMCSLINESVVLIKQIYGPKKTTVQIVRLGINIILIPFVVFWTGVVRGLDPSRLLGRI